MAPAAHREHKLLDIVADEAAFPFGEGVLQHDGFHVAIEIGLAWSGRERDVGVLPSFLAGEHEGVITSLA